MKVTCTLCNGTGHIEIETAEGGMEHGQQLIALVAESHCLTVKEMLSPSRRRDLAAADEAAKGEREFSLFTRKERFKAGLEKPKAGEDDLVTEADVAALPWLRPGRGWKRSTAISALKPPSEGGGILQEMFQQSDPKAIAQGIVEGSFPPDISQYSRYLSAPIAT